MVEFPGYSGPPWIQHYPKWIPITVDKGRCDRNCCSRKGIPLMPGYAITIAKSPGMTVGNNQPLTHTRVKLQKKNVMEKLNLGTTYTALSSWVLVEKVPEERIMYIDTHPHMKARREEEMGINALSEETLKKYGMYQNAQKYITLLQELDAYCQDNIRDSQCHS